MSSKIVTHEIQEIAKTHKPIGGKTVFFSNRYSSSIVKKNFFLPKMPKRSLHHLQRQFEKELNERLDLMEKYIAQVRRASEFAKEGKIQDSYNILSTIGDVYGIEVTVADFVQGSDLLWHLQDIRDEYLSLNQ